MDKKHLNLLEEMIGSCSLSGYNDEAISIFLREANKLGLICGRDVLGNTSVKLPAASFSADKKNIVICSHSDTHGHLVDYVHEDTIYLKTASYEGCEGKEGIVRTQTDIVPVIFFDVNEEKNTVKAKTIDKKDIKKINSGDVASMKPWIKEKIRGKLSGTFLDNKIGCLITTVLMEKLKDKNLSHNVFIVHTSFEETGQSFGIISAVQKIKPWFVINVDMGPVETKSQLGKGPIIYLGPQFNKVLTNKLITICKEKNIPYTTEICVNESSTDHDFIPALNGGVASCELAYPGMNYHEFEEHVSKRDIYRTVNLLVELLSVRLGSIDSLIYGRIKNGM